MLTVEQLREAFTAYVKHYPHGRFEITSDETGKHTITQSGISGEIAPFFMFEGHLVFLLQLNWQNCMYNVTPGIPERVNILSKGHRLIDGGTADDVHYIAIPQWHRLYSLVKILPGSCFLIGEWNSWDPGTITDTKPGFYQSDFSLDQFSGELNAGFPSIILNAGSFLACVGVIKDAAQLCHVTYEQQADGHFTLTITV